MTLALTLERLRALKPLLSDRFGVTGLSVFGSWVRGEQKDGSDLDLLVDFATPPSLFQLARLDRLLHDTLGLTVDTVPRDSLNPRYAKHILAELQIV